MAATKLKAVEPKTAKPNKPKILVYGKAGAGKTWASLDFPNVYYIDCEGGANLDHYTDKLKNSGGAYLGPEEGALDFETVIEQVRALGTEKHNYKTLVIDSITKLYNTAIGDEMDRLGEKDQYGASKKKPVSYMRRLVSWLSRIDMNVILVAHEKSEWGLNAQKERVEIGTTFDCWDKLEYELDLALRVYKIGDKRMASVRKSRIATFEDATSFPWSYKDFADKFGKDAIEKAGDSLNLATPEQLKTIKKLLETVKLPEGQEEKWLKKANVEGWDEMDSERIDLAIQHIRSTYIEGEE